MSRLLQDYSIEQKGADLLASQGFMERWEEDTTMFVPLHIKALSNANYSLALLIEHHREPENEKKKALGEPNLKTLLSNPLTVVRASQGPLTL